MANTTYSKEYDDFVSSTLDMYTQTHFANNVYDDVTFFKWLTAKGRARPFSGGGDIIVPVQLSTNGTAKAYAEFEDLDVTPANAGTIAKFTPGRAAVTVAISGDEKDRNVGKSAIIDLLQAKMEHAEQAMADLLATAVFSTNAGTDGKSVIGLRAMVAADPSTVTVGGIATSETAWRNQTDTNAYVFSTDGERLWSAMFNSCSNHGTTPDMIVTTQAIYQRYEQELRDRGILSYSGANVGDGSYKALQFKGVDIIWDRKCPANHTWFLTSKRLDYRFAENRHFKLSNPKEPADKDGVWWQIIERSQLTCSDRSVQGLMSGAVT